MQHSKIWQTQFNTKNVLEVCPDDFNKKINKKLTKDFYLVS